MSATAAAAASGGGGGGGGIYTNGFQEFKQILPKDLVEKLLASSKDEEGYTAISEAVQKDLTPEEMELLSTTVNEYDDMEHGGGGATVLKMVQAAFPNATSYLVQTGKLLTAARGSKPQIPHADMSCNAAIFGIVQLQDDQAPTLCHDSFDINHPYPTFISMQCCICHDFWPLTDAQLRSGEHLRTDPRRRLVRQKGLQQTWCEAKKTQDNAQ